MKKIKKTLREIKNNKKRKSLLRKVINPRKMIKERIQRRMIKVKIQKRTIKVKKRRKMPKKRRSHLQRM